MPKKQAASRAGGLPASAERLLLQALHDLIECSLCGPRPRLRKRGQRIVHQIQEFREARLLGINVKDTGENLTLGMRLHQYLDGVHAVGWVEALMQLAQPQ